MITLGLAVGLTIWAWLNGWKGHALRPLICGFLLVWSAINNVFPFWSINPEVVPLLDGIVSIAVCVVLLRMCIVKPPDPLPPLWPDRNWWREPFWGKKSRASATQPTLLADGTPCAAPPTYIKGPLRTDNKRSPNLPFADCSLPEREARMLAFRASQEKE